MGFNIVTAVICKYKTKILTRVWHPPRYVKEHVFKFSQGKYITSTCTPAPLPPKRASIINSPLSEHNQG